MTALLVGIALLIGACGSDAPETASSDGRPLVDYAKTGGVAGVNEHLQVDADGSALLEVGYGQPARQRFVLEAEELERLREVLAAADFAAIDTGPGLSCADCFMYEISYDGTTAAFAQIGDIPSSVGEAVAELERIVAKHSPATAPPG